MAGKDEDATSNLRNEALRIAAAGIFPMVLKSAIELNIIDTLYAAGDNHFLSSSEIASTIPSSKNSESPLILDRMLLFLATRSILDCSLRTKENGDTERLYAARPICKFFTKNQGGEESLAHVLLLNHDKVFMESWYHLNDAILDGGIPFDRAYGMAAFDYFGTDQRLNMIFNQSMFNLSTMVMKTVLETYKGFEGVKVLVDVGGGIGECLGKITSKYPQIKGINFDLPHVLADAPTYTGVKHIVGDMFQCVPNGDATLLKMVLHDWGDNHCIKILKNCYEALPNGGKAIIVELLLPEPPFNSSDSDIT